MLLVALMMSERESDVDLVTMELVPDVGVLAPGVAEVSEGVSTSALSFPFCGPPPRRSLKLSVEAMSCRFSSKLSWSRECDLTVGGGLEVLEGDVSIYTLFILRDMAAMEGDVEVVTGEAMLEVGVVGDVRVALVEKEEEVEVYEE